MQGVTLLNHLVLKLFGKELLVIMLHNSKNILDIGLQAFLKHLNPEFYLDIIWYSI